MSLRGSLIELLLNRCRIDEACIIFQLRKAKEKSSAVLRKFRKSGATVAAQLTGLSNKNRITPCLCRFVRPATDSRTGGRK